MSFTQKQQSQTENISNQFGTKSTLYALRDFIRVLSLNPVDGKLIMHLPGEKPGKLTDCELEYLSLNPAVQINRMLG